MACGISEVSDKESDQDPGFEEDDAISDVSSESLEIVQQTRLSGQTSLPEFVREQLEQQKLQLEELRSVSVPFFFPKQRHFKWGDAKYIQHVVFSPM